MEDTGYYLDPATLDDPRLLQRLLELQSKFTLPTTYYGTVQDEIDAEARNICLEWLLEVCEEEKCDGSVYPLTVNFVDRFLAKRKWQKCTAQLLCCACLMLASKMRQRNSLSATVLSYYTEESCFPSEILSMESLVASVLEWNLGAVIPYDFVDTLLHRLPETYGVRQLAGKHAKAYQKLITMEPDYPTWPPSYVAVGSIGAALRGLPDIKVIWPFVKCLTGLLYEITGIQKDIINYSIEYTESFVDNWKRKAREAQATNATTEQLVHKRNPNDNDDDDDDDGPYPPISIMDFEI